MWCRRVKTCDGKEQARRVCTLTQNTLPMPPNTSLSSRALRTCVRWKMGSGEPRGDRAWDQVIQGWNHNWKPSRCTMYTAVLLWGHRWWTVHPRLTFLDRAAWQVSRASMGKEGMQGESCNTSTWTVSSCGGPVLTGHPVKQDIPVLASFTSLLPSPNALSNLVLGLSLKLKEEKLKNPSLSGPWPIVTSEII